MIDDIKSLLDIFRLNPATGLPCEFLICCNTINNDFDMFDEVAQVLENVDSNYHKEASAKLEEESLCRLLESYALTCTGHAQEKMRHHIIHVIVAIKTFSTLKFEIFISHFSFFRWTLKSYFHFKVWTK